MNTKTMEGLIGAGTNINLVNTPIRVFKEARRKGDTATMERAMGYAGEFAKKAEEYRAHAAQGTREETEKAREEAELEREKSLEKRREERDRLEEELAVRREEGRSFAEGIDEASTDPEISKKTAVEAGNALDHITDTLEISEAGRRLSALNTSVSV